MNGSPPGEGRLRVALAPADPEQADRLTRMVGEAGHVVAADPAEADVLLIELAAGGNLPRTIFSPTLVLSDDAGLSQDRWIAGVLPRTVSSRWLEAALRAVAAGLHVRVASRAEPEGFAAAEDEGPPVLLTPREMEILTAISEGASNKQVARRLAISAHTVKFHLEAIFAKLEVGSRAEAVAKGLRRGLIEI